MTGRSVILGLLLFGADLLLFNFFMPLVFDADIPDLILRTAVDVLTVTAGCLTSLCPAERRAAFLAVDCREVNTVF